MKKHLLLKSIGKLNLWYDHGLGIGGNLVDFGILYYKCSVKELLYKLGNQKEVGFSFHPQAAGEKKEKDQKQEKIIITDTREITNPSLTSYLEVRHIPLGIANRFCIEVDFILYGKKANGQRQQELSKNSNVLPENGTATSA